MSVTVPDLGPFLKACGDALRLSAVFLRHVRTVPDLGLSLRPVVMVSDLGPFLKACDDGLSLRAVFLRHVSNGP